MDIDETISDGEERPVGSGELLQTLLATGNLERVHAEARRFLSLDPGDFYAHYYAALALIDLKRFAEAKGHLDFLRSAQPDSPSTRFAAVAFHTGAEHWREAAREAAEGMRVAPELACFPYYAAIADLNRLRLPAAREHIARARTLDPDDADIANLYISIHGLEKTSAEDGLRRLDDYAEALRLDPANAGLHHSMGQVCLDPLDDPAAAEAHFREALRLDPSMRLYQSDLFEAVARRSLLYRTLSIPSRTFAWVAAFGRVVVAQPWRLILLLIGFKVVAAFLLWLAVATFVLWPGGKVYEWLLVSEIRDAAALSDARLRLRFRLHRLPRWLRFFAFLVVCALGWLGLFALLGASLKVAAGLLLLPALFAATHFAFVAIASFLRRWQAHRARARRRAIPPPLPAGRREG